MQFELNFPDALWGALKRWAKEQAESGITPTLEQCSAEVSRISQGLIGPAHTLRAEVVEFYATEASDMVTRYGSLGRPLPEPT